MPENPTVIYIAGKITGNDHFREDFAAAAARLEKAGCIVLNPATLPQGMPYESYFPICFAMIDVADAVYFLHNSKESAGAKRELEYAYAKHKRIQYEREPPVKPKPPKRPPPVPCQRIMEMYNEICGALLPAAAKLTDGRRTVIKARYADGYTLEDFQRLFRAAAASKVLTGRTDRGWRANFDWLIKPANMVKVLEGNYSDGDQLPGEHSPSYDLDAFERLALAQTPKL